MSTFLNSLKDWLPLVPFLMTGERRANGKTNVSVTRLIEAFIIAGISGAVAVYGTTVKLSGELEQVVRNQIRIEVEIKEIKEFARLTRETQLKVMDARGARLDAIDKQLDQIDKRLK